MASVLGNTISIDMRVRPWRPPRCRRGPCLLACPCWACVALPQLSWQKNATRRLDLEDVPVAERLVAHGPVMWKLDATAGADRVW